MPTIIKNLEQLTKVLELKIIEILEFTAKDVKQEIDKYLQKYYDEYNPALGKSMRSLFYQRTDQLRNCCKIGKLKNNNGNINIEVYLDIDSLNYSTPGADAFKTLRAADSGLHGGWDVSNLQSGQVSWSTISGNTGESWGSGTQIWEEPMKELIDNGKLITIFKKYAKQRGLNIK